MDEEDEPGVESHFIEADQDLETNLENTRENLPKILKKVLEHEAAVQDLQQEYAAKKISPDYLKMMLKEHAMLVRRLKHAEEIFRMRADELEERLNLKR